MKKLLLLSFALLSLWSCTNPEPHDPNIVSTHNNVLIGNEGGFTKNNASLSMFNPSNGLNINQIFFQLNKFPLGDILQSIYSKGSNLYLVVNNSGVVHVCDATSLTYKGTIKGLTSPRYVVENEGRLYISDLYSAEITIADPQTYEKIGTINTGACVEQMIVKDGFLYAAAYRKGKQIIKIQLSDNSIVGSVEVGHQPVTMVMDNQGKLWALCDGGYKEDWSKLSAPSICRVDPASMTVLQTLTFADANVTPSKLTVSGDGTKLFYIKSGYGSETNPGGVYRMNTTDATLPATPFIKEQGATFYGLGVHPVSGTIYVSDAGDYTSAGTILVYDANAAFKHNFKADIIPGFFWFM